MKNRKLAVTKSGEDLRSRRIVWHLKIEAKNLSLIFVAEKYAGNIDRGMINVKRSKKDGLSNCFTLLGLENACSERSATFALQNNISFDN
jgi:hypothetical protein